MEEETARNGAFRPFFHSFLQCQDYARGGRGGAPSLQFYFRDCGDCGESVCRFDTPVINRACLACLTTRTHRLGTIGTPRKINNRVVKTRRGSLGFSASTPILVVAAVVCVCPAEKGCCTPYTSRKPPFRGQPAQGCSTVLPGVCCSEIEPESHVVLTKLNQQGTTCRQGCAPDNSCPRKGAVKLRRRRALPFKPRLSKTHPKTKTVCSLLKTSPTSVPSR